MKSLARIGVLEQMRAVEVRKSMFVRREMRWDPVQDDADSVLMKHVDEVLEILRRAVAARRREKSSDLISPRAVKRVLHDRHELDVREVHLAHIVRQRLRDFAITHRTRAVIVDRPPPRSDMDFVDGDRRLDRVARLSIAHPAFVIPLVVEIPDDRCCFRRRFVMNSERVRFVDAVIVLTRDDVVLVNRSLTDVRNESFPDAGRAARIQLVLARIPTVEFADDRHGLRVWRPNAEACPGNPIALDQMRAEFFPQPVVVAFVEKIDVLIAEKTLLTILFALARPRRGLRRTVVFRRLARW